jgi:aryl-alcohol dehydrogenase-like predicted oxidoreductase
VDTIYDVIEPLTRLAAEKSVPLSQLALAWVAQQPGITSPIIGPRTLEQLEDALKALEITLKAEDLRRIDEIIPPGTHVSPFYEAEHGVSLHRW